VFLASGHAAEKLFKGNFSRLYVLRCAAERFVGAAYNDELQALNSRVCWHLLFAHGRTSFTSAEVATVLTDAKERTLFE
jgi:hypothetical protein